MIALILALKNGATKFERSALPQLRHQKYGHYKVFVKRHTESHIYLSDLYEVTNIGKPIESVEHVISTISLSGSSGRGRVRNRKNVFPLEATIKSKNRLDTPCFCRVVLYRLQRVSKRTWSLNKGFFWTTNRLTPRRRNCRQRPQCRR
jgi:hypothetical protein